MRVDRDELLKLAFRSDLRPYSEQWFDAVDGCIKPDPIRPVLEALCAEAEEWNESDKDTWFVITPERIRAILASRDQ